VHLTGKRTKILQWPSPKALNEMYARVLAEQEILAEWALKYGKHSTKVAKKQLDIMRSLDARIIAVHNQSKSKGRNTAGIDDEV